MRWPIPPLAEVAPIRSRKPEIFDGTRRYYSTGAVGKNGELDTPELVTFAERPSRANCMPKIGDVGFARMSGTQKVVLVSEAELGSLFSTGFCFLEPNDALDSKYLFYFLTSEGFQSEKNALAGEGIMGGIKNSDVVNMQIPLPPMAEQQRIVRLLDEALEGIDIAKANAEKNLQNARALFESYLRAAFTQGGLERDGVERGQGAGMSGSWPVKTLAEVCQLKPRKNEAREKLSPADEVSFVPMEDLGINLKHFKALKSRPLLDVASGYTYFAEGDVLLAKITPCFENGKLGIATDLKNGVGFGSSEFYVLRPHENLSAEWLYYYLNRETFRVEGAARMSGAVGHRRVTKEFIETYPIPLPPLSEQQRIVNLLGKLQSSSESMVAIQTKKIVALENLKRSLLSQAFSGGMVVD